MREDILKQIREDALSKRKETDDFNNKVRRIRELEQDPNVMEYSMLLKSIVGNPRYISLKDDDIYDLSFRNNLGNIKQDETNNIYVYLGPYETNDYFGIKLSEADPKACFKKYWNIELGIFTFVDIRFAKNFEESNIILFGEKDGEMGLYREVQNLFVKTAIEQNQEEAVKLVLKKYKSNKKDTNEN